MRPRCPVGRETELAGLGWREGLEGWSPLPPAGAVDRKEEVSASLHAFPFPALSSFRSTQSRLCHLGDCTELFLP